MEETEHPIEAGQPRRRLLWSAVIVTLAAALVALGLSIYNTVRFDQRVHGYISAHRSALAGAQGPQGPQGPRGPRGATGLPGITGPAGKDAFPVDLSSYSSCLERQLSNWMVGASVTTSAFNNRIELDVPLLIITCS